MTQLPKNTPPVKGPIPLRLPPNLEAVYANFALITHSPAEVVVDFAHLLPGMNQARVCARVVMSPLSAKLVLRALTENLAKYEAQYGEIRIPEGATLAGQLFGRPIGHESEPDSPPTE